MAVIGKMKIDVTIRYKWLLVIINYPLVKLGFKPYVPSVCVKYSKPYFKGVVK